MGCTSELKITSVLLLIMLLCVNYSYSSSSSEINDETPADKMEVAVNDKKNIFGDWNTTMKAFDKHENQELYLEEFGELCKNLFVDKDGKSYSLSNETVQELFTIFDRDGNGFICKKEFPTCYEQWIKKIVNPVSVLVIVDVQNDFIDGTLALRNAPGGQEGLDVIEPINKMQDTIHFKQVFYTKDWHPPNHISFIENVKLRSLAESSKIADPEQIKLYNTVVFKGDSGQLVEQRMWPRHCVQNTSGADLHAKLKILPGSLEVFKGEQPDLDSYSAFMDNDKKSLTKLKEYVDGVGAQDVYVCGLAYDICVGATTLDSLSLGYRTILVDDASRGVDLQGIEKIKKDVAQANGVVVMSDQVKDMVEGIDRRPELGLHLARGLKMKWAEQVKQKEM